MAMSYKEGCPCPILGVRPSALILFVQLSSFNPFLRFLPSSIFYVDTP
jgi:hypothetical protein